MNPLNWYNATPAQKNLLQYVKTLLVGVQTIISFYFQGVIGGSEFLTYDAKKLYLYLELEFSSWQGPKSLAGITMYDNTNNPVHNIGLGFYYYDPVAGIQKIDDHTSYSKNGYFSRIVNTNMDTIKFNGYKMTIP